MEVTPEIFAWLTSLNIINPFVSFSQDLVNDFQIPEKTMSLLFGGKYIDIMIQQLQDAYNKFYKINEDYSSDLLKLKQIPEGEEYISNSLKYTNWKIIFEVLGHFGLTFSDNDLSLIINNNPDQLKKVISKIYNTYERFLNGTNDINKINEYYKNNNYNYNSINTTKEQNEIQNEIITKEKIKTENSKINISEINPLKKYEECNSLLELMIISLCKNMNMKPRQAVSLLYKNRKYLKKICISGFNYEFQPIRNWLSDLYNNNKTVINLLTNTDDGLSMFYSIIGSALYCKDIEISLQSAQLLNLIKYKVGMNWDWFYNEGINVLIFVINKENNHRRKDFFKLLYDFIRDNLSLFFDEIKKKFNTENLSEKKPIYDFINYIMNFSDIMEQDFSNYFQNFLFDVCIKHKKTDISFNLSILSDAFFNFSPIDENSAAKIISYFKDCIKSNKSNIFSSGILQVFYLMERFGKIKNKYAPNLYKILTFQFLEDYDNEIKRELYLDNFEKFFNDNQNIPIDILLESYINKIMGYENYNLSDFLFLLKMVEHPRIKSKELLDIIQFLLNVCLYSVTYGRSANLILSLIFEKDLINKFANEEDDIMLNINNAEVSFIEEIETKFIEFINTALDLYISNISNQEDKFILETPYDIMTQNFENVNMQVKDMVVNCVKQYRKIKGCHSSGLLSMMWYYSDNDDIMMQIEELNRPIYEPMKLVLERKRLEKEEKDKHDYTKQLIISLSKLREKRINTLLNKQQIEEQKKYKEGKEYKQMMEKRRIMRLMSGIEGRPKPPILGPIPKMSKSNSDFYEQINKFNFLHQQKKIETGDLKSNMKYAVNNAAQNYMVKGIISENSSFYKKINYETNSQNKMNITKSKSEVNIFNNKNEEEVIKKYEKYMNIEKKTKYKQESSEIKFISDKFKASNLLIQKEGSLIKYGIQNKKNLLPRTIFVEYLGIPLDLNEEESRELKAIMGYNKQFSKNIKSYFKLYSNEAKQKISKAKLVHLLRDIGLDQEKISSDEISTLIRLMFQDNFSEFDFNQFINLLVQLSYIIYTKRRPCLTIGETYSVLLKRFSLKKLNQERISSLKKRYSLVIDYLLQLKECKEQFNMPEGFKFVKNTFVRYNCRLAPHMKNYIGESKFICYQILEEIIYDACKSSILEPYVEVSNEDLVDIEPDKIHNWSPGLTIAYIDLDKNLKFYGLFAADALEDGIKKMLKKNYGENADGKMIKYAKGVLNVKWVKQDLEKKKEFRLRQLIEIERRRINGEIDKDKYKPSISKKEYEKVEEKFKEASKRRKLKQNEKIEKKIEREKVAKAKKEKRNIEMIPFFKTEKKKLKEKFKSITIKQNELKKEREEEEKKEIEKYKRRKYHISKKEKDYNEFEKNIYNSMKQLLEKNEIKECLDKYMNHLQIIYNIYSKIGYNKISFKSKEVIHMEEFNQFLINFAILGIYITSDQMSWIFKNIAKVSQNDRYNEMFFDFNDFILSICYLTIFSKYENKTLKITPKDIEETTEKNIEKFLQNLGLKLPFDKVELEKFINERRSMTMKNLLNLQHIKKLEEAKNFINNNKKIKNEKNVENERNNNGNDIIENNKKTHDIKNNKNKPIQKNNQNKKNLKINSKDKKSRSISDDNNNNIEEKAEDEENEEE